MTVYAVLLSLVLAQSREMPRPPRCECVIAHSSQVYCAVFDSDCRRIASASHDGTIDVWDIATQQRIVTFAVPQVARCVQFSADGRKIICGHSRGVAIFDLASRTPCFERETRYGIQGAVFTKDDKRVIFADAAGYVETVDTEFGRSISRCRPTKSATAIALRGDDGAILIGRLNGVLVIGIPNSDRVDTIPLASNEEAHAVAYSPDGKQIVAGLSRVYGGMGTGAGPPTIGLVRIWEADSNVVVFDTIADRERVSAVALDSDGRWLASAGREDCIKVWDTKARKSVLELAGHVGGTNSLAFSRDDMRLLSAGNDNAVKVLACSPFLDPGAMRVSTARNTGTEATHETTTSHAGTDHRQAA